MLKAERQELILQRVAADGRVLVGPLAEELGLTEDTIRKDLQYLSRRGVHTRVHGGAVRADRELERFEERVDVESAAKHRLAQAAMEEIAAHRVIFIDGGSTNYIAAQQLPREFDGTVITNNPAVALLLADWERAAVQIIPGQIHRRSKEAVGSQALEAIRDLHVDLALIGVSSIDAQYGIFVPYLESMVTKRAVLDAGATVASLITAEKFGRRSTYRVAGCERLDVVFTDAPESETAELAARGVTVRPV